MPWCAAKVIPVPYPILNITGYYPFDEVGSSILVQVFEGGSGVTTKFTDSENIHKYFMSMILIDD
jgi:hypothetical protein